MPESQPKKKRKKEKKKKKKKRRKKKKREVGHSKSVISPAVISRLNVIDTCFVFITQSVEYIGTISATHTLNAHQQVFVLRSRGITFQ